MKQICVPEKNRTYDPPINGRTLYPQGDSHIKVTGVIAVRVKIRYLVSLRVLKSKMTSIRGMVVPFRVLSRKIWEEVNVSQPIFSFCLKCWYVLGVKKLFGPRPENRILVPCRAFFSDDHPRHFYMVAPPRGGALPLCYRELVSRWAIY